MFDDEQYNAGKDKMNCNVRSGCSLFPLPHSFPYFTKTEKKEAYNY
jgi:hypothetical protein